MTMLLIGLGGFAGAIARYVVDLGVSTALGSRFPLGILIVNVSGAFVLGLLYALVVERAVMPDAVRWPVFVGFLGAYTTFSTLMLDSWRLSEAGAVAAALVNLAGSMTLGMLAVGAGLVIGRMVGSS